MALITVNKNPSQNELKWFGLLLLAFFGVIGFIAVWRFDAWTLATVLWVSATTITVAYYLLPPIQKPLVVGWMYAMLPIGLTTSFALMLLTYYVVLTPIGLLLRLFHINFFDKTPDQQVKSYWTTHQTPSKKQRYFQQF